MDLMKKYHHVRKLSETTQSRRCHHTHFQVMKRFSDELKY